MAPLLLCTLFFLLTAAIEVTNISSCASDCGGGLTFSTDLACQDVDYSTSATGQKMEKCLLCESTSTASNGDFDNDIYWFLFNMKYTAQYCLYDNTTNTQAMPKCQSACEPLKPVLEVRWFESDGSFADQYGYCNLSGGAFGQYVEGCSSCLQGVKGSVVLGNFLETMQQGCKTKPQAAQGSIISLQRQLFNTSTVTTSTSASSTSTSNSKSASPTSTSNSKSASPTSTSNPAPAPASSSSSTSSSSLSAGAAAGIGVGVGTAAFLALGALVWFLLRRRRRISPSERVEGIKDPLPPQYYQPPQQKMPPQQLDGTPVAEAYGDPTKFITAELPGK